MTNLLNWQQSHPQTNPMNPAVGDIEEYVVYLSSLNESDEASFQKAVQESVDKAISLFDLSVLDESRYFICEWDVVYSTLTIVISDDSKQNDSKYIVKCLMSALDDEINAIDSDWKVKTEEYSENIKYWISNYLTTHAEFMQYSLIALFQTESREKTLLL